MNRFWDFSSWKFWCSLIFGIALFQVASFYAPHIEGDELVFLGLSQNMDWDLSHYTVMNISPLNEFPNRLYRASIFMHPPLFPVLLKIGGSFMNPVVFGIILNGLLKFLLAFTVYLSAKRMLTQERGARLAGVLVSVCPINGFIGSRILSDSLFVLGFWLTLLFLIDAVERASYKAVVGATIAFCFLLNSKFQGLFLVPAFLFGLMLACGRMRAAKVPGKVILLTVFFSLILVLSLGFPHYFRLLDAFGLKGVADLMTVERPVSEFIRRVSERGRGKMFLYLLCIYPLFIVLVSPQLWRSILFESKSRWAWVLTGIFTLNALLLNMQWCYQQERYWAVVVPFGFLAIGHRFQTGRSIVSAFLILLTINHFFTNVLTAGSTVAIVYPVIFRFIPPLMSHGFLFGGF